MAPFPTLIGGSGTAASLVLDAQETINYVVEKAQSQSAQNDGALLATPGFTAWAHLTQTGCRGAIFLADVPTLLVISGNTLFEIDQNGTPTLRATVAIDAHPAQLVYNQQNGQVGVCSGGNVYCYTVATHTLSAALLTGGFTHLAFAGGFGFAFQYTSGTTFVAAVNDLSNWQSSSVFFRRGVFADPPQAIFADENNLLWTLGTETFEVRWNSGIGNQPWVPLSGLVGPWGIASMYGYGLSSSGNFWIARNQQGIGRFVVSSGSGPSPVGTYAIDAQIDKIAASAGIDDAEVLLYDQGGHVSANVALAKGQAVNTQTPCTFSYDVTGQAWTKRGQWMAKSAQWGLWAPRIHVLAYGKHLVGDRTTGTLWILDQTSATDVDGSGIRRLRRTPHLNHEHLRIPLDRVELLCATGLGLQSGQGADPKMMMRLSIDGGVTWDSERQAGLGPVGQYRTQVYWSQLGAPMDAVLEFSMSEPIPGHAIIAGYINNTESPAVPRGRR